MNQKIKKSNYELSILIIQIAVVTLIIAAVFIVKFINIEWFNVIKGFYIGNFTADTSVDEVLLDDESNLESTMQLMPVSSSFSKKTTQKLLINPLDSIIVTSPYGWRKSPIDGEKEFHKGVDLSGEIGDEIFATAGGEVIISQYSPTYGNYIKIKHSNGISTLYAHCEKLFKDVGEKVEVGETIASLGSTGRSTAPHLHYEVILNEQNINPEWLISK